MTDEVSNLILEHFKHLRGEIAAVRTEQRNQRDRLASLENHAVVQRRDQAESMAAFASIHVRLDRMSDQLERIETRLGLVDPAL